VARTKELLGYGLSVRKIAKVLGYSSHIALNTYINKRGLREADVLMWLKSKGRGYQTRINAILRDAMLKELK
jgi:hypothetical protein